MARVLLPLALSMLIAIAGSAYGQGAPVISMSHYVDPAQAGASTLLTTCPQPLSGQQCTDTQVVAIERKEPGGPSATTISFLQRTYIVDGPSVFVSAMFGSGQATLSVASALSAAVASAQIDLIVCDSNFQCAPPRSADLTAAWSATGALLNDGVGFYGFSGTMRILTGLSQSRSASANGMVNGVLAPGSPLPSSTEIFRARYVEVCMSVYPNNC